MSTSLARYWGDNEEDLYTGATKITYLKVQQVKFLAAFKKRLICITLMDVVGADADITNMCFFATFHLCAALQ